MDHEKLVGGNEGMNLAIPFGETHRFHTVDDIHFAPPTQKKTGRII